MSSADQQSPHGLGGVHHATALSRDPAVNADFYTRVLGQRIVKRTVNFDSPDTLHLYYGDYLGSPGTVMTFFPWSLVADGYPGAGDFAALAWAVPTGSIDYWRDRLEETGANPQQRVRFGEHMLVFRDPEGLRGELIATDRLPPAEVRDDGPVPREHAIRGFYGATLWYRSQAPTAALLTDRFGYIRVEQEEDPAGRRIRFAAPPEDSEPGAGQWRPGSAIDVVVNPSFERGKTGAGSIHHVAFRTLADEQIDLWPELLRAEELDPTEVVDRFYFRGMYVREPGGALFEIANNAPGFTRDESPETLGTHLALPPWLEHQRSEIESKLPELDR